MLKKRWDESRMPLRHVTEGPDRVPHRSYYHATGITDEEMAARHAAWQPRRTDYNSSAIWKFAQTVGPAHLGAVTNTGARAETHRYADI